MAQNTLADLSTTAASNVDFRGQSIAGTASVSTIDNMLQNLAVMLARFYDDIGATGTVSGSANAISLTSGSGFSSLANGNVVWFKAAAANTGAVTINVDGLGARAIRRQGDSALEANDLLANAVYGLRYDTAYNGGAGAWVLLNSSGLVGSTLSLAAGGSITFNGGGVSIYEYSDSLSFEGASNGYGFDTGAVFAGQVTSTAFGFAAGTAGSTPSGGSLSASAGSGTNVAGGALALYAGNGTGTGGSGPITFYTASPGTSGSTANTLTERLRIANTGTLTSQPTYDNTASGSTVVVTSAGFIRRTSSSLKYKKDVETLDHALADHAVQNLRPVWYRTKAAEGDDKATWSHIGLIAEEVDQVEPRLVRYRTVSVAFEERPELDANGMPVLNHDGTPKTVTERVETPLATPEPEDVDYGRLSVLLLDVVQRQQTAIAELQAQMAALSK